LGYVNPDFFAGGSLKLKPELAHRVIEDKVARPLGMTLEQAALGIHRVLNAQMAEGIRLVSIRQGLDPRRFALLPLGGGGAVHATALARDLNIMRIVVPRTPGVLSAAGLLAAPVEHEVSAAFGRALTDTGVADLREALARLDKECARLMSKERLDREAVSIHYLADVCYIGQSYTLEILLRLDAPDPMARLYEEFLENHDRVYGHATRTPARIVNLRSVHQAGGLDRIDGGAFKPTGGKPQKAVRPVLTAGASGFVDAAIYERAAMPAGFSFKGPAIVEQTDTTTLVEPGWAGAVDDAGNLILSWQGA
jgi:N-methylhydantoinase A